MKKLITFTVAVVLTACTFAPTESGVSTPIVITAEMSTILPEDGGTILPGFTLGPPTSLPTLASGISITELKYRVLDEFPDFFFCDPDYYPVAREDELLLARERFPELQSNQEEFSIILSHNGLGGTTSFSDEQKLVIYREHKKLNAIYFEPAGDRYRFQIQTGFEGQPGSAITGTIDGNGSVDVLQREESFPACPICLAAGTLIDTPRGAVGVENLRVGDPVWTTAESGERVKAVILRVGRARVPVDHQMIHVLLSDGRELWASAGHPTANGGTFADLKLGDSLDGAQIVQLEQQLYRGVYTFDILPSGTTSLYWANAILVGSTLTHDR